MRALTALQGGWGIIMNFLNLREPRKTSYPENPAFKNLTKPILLKSRGFRGAP